MPLWRRKMPPDLREALDAAERLGGRRGARRRGLARRLLRPPPMAAWFALLFAAVLAVGEWGLLRVPWLGAPAPLPGVLQRVPDGGSGRAAFTARVGIIDGDTLANGGMRLRVHGIDAPESAQTCRRPSGDYLCGQEASRAMARILGGGMVSCQTLDTDRYGRLIVRCHNAEGVDIGAEMVRQGWALAFTRFSTDYAGQEAEARAARRGLWAGRFESPWDWRARHRP